jgi:CRISPR-associated protein (TIGR03984 family)
MYVRGAEIESIGFSDALDILTWVSGGERPDCFKLTLNEARLLAHCEDGVVWGYLHEDSWRLSSSVFPEVSPVIKAGGANLLELRVFNRTGEVMLWRRGSGITGRLIQDQATQLEQDDPFRPHDESYVLWGSRLVKSEGGFSLVAESTGVRHAVPVCCNKDDFPLAGKGQTRRPWHPLRLDARQYFSQCDDSGAIRIAAYRLMGVRKEAYPS